MEIEIRRYTREDIDGMIPVWNEVVEAGDAFPQTEPFNEKTAPPFFEGQSYCGVAAARDTGRIVGLYILHPNNIGRCGHIANASYAVAASARGLKIGEKLVLDCMEQGKRLGFRILQFNAVVRTNTAARRLYEKLGFRRLGVIPGGFLIKDGHYEDICPYYRIL